MLKARGIGLLSLEEKIGTSLAAGKLVFHAFGAIAHFERQLIGERTRDGVEVAKTPMAASIGEDTTRQTTQQASELARK
jgi:DNA invertase Pin-like site-specific DNA recombinase